MRWLFFVALISLGLSGCTLPENAEAPSWQAGDPVPRLLMRADEASNKLWHVKDIIDAPLSRADTVFGTKGCRWQTGETAIVTVGDSVSCPDEKLTILHAPSGDLVHSNCSGCVQNVPAPRVAFNKDASAGSITLITAPNGLYWRDFQVTTTCPTGPPDGNQPVRAGNIASSGCRSGHTVDIHHIESDTRVYQTQF